MGNNHGVSENETRRRRQKLWVWKNLLRVFLLSGSALRFFFFVFFFFSFFNILLSDHKKKNGVSKKTAKTEESKWRRFYTPFLFWVSFSFFSWAAQNRDCCSFSRVHYAYNVNFIYIYFFRVLFLFLSCFQCEKMRRK